MLIFKGFIIGFLMLVPGLSGGSLALGLGIYDEILSRCSHFFKDWKKNLIFFLKLIIGGIFGLFFASFTLLSLLEYNQNLIIGLMMMVMMVILVNHFKSYYKQLKWWHYVYLILGVFLLLCFNNLNKLTVHNEWLCFLFAGLLLAIAFILPGISFSYVLVLLGLYDKLLLAITTFDFCFLFKLGGCFLLGIIISVKTIDYLFKRFTLTMNNIILGFVIASLILVVPFEDYASVAYFLIMASIGMLVGVKMNR